MAYQAGDSNWVNGERSTPFKYTYQPRGITSNINAQKRSLTARYVVRKLTGSFHKRCATRLRAAPPITIKLNSDPPMAIPKPASNIRTYRATRASLEVTNIARKAMVVSVEPTAET